jgi:hypothetical protein
MARTRLETALGDRMAARWGRTPGEAVIDGGNHAPRNRPCTRCGGRAKHRKDPCDGVLTFTWQPAKRSQ